jgi:hypothetical protein
MRAGFNPVSAVYKVVNLNFKSIPMQKQTSLFLIYYFIGIVISFKGISQCAIFPVSFEQRVSNAAFIVQGKVTLQHTYLDTKTGSVNTLNELQINAWLKNYRAEEKVYVITIGGVFENRATIAHPALQLSAGAEYLLMLETDNQLNDDKSFRAGKPGALQMLTYADQQGAFMNFNQLYTDLADKSKSSEEALFARIASITGEQSRKPNGDVFRPREVVAGGSQTMIEAITSFSPNPTRSGTIDPGDFVTITGSGFGAGAGTVFFTNADDGGATFTSSGIASDIVSWSDGSITVKPARRGGTGPINVNGTQTSASNLTINYSHLDVNSSFSGFGSNTRQRYYHRNKNGLGGYTYLYNTTSGFAGNAPAIAAFNRVLSTWRCGTYINFRTGGTTAAGLNGADGNNVVLFDGTLPAGVLARATSNFSGSSTGGCNLTNTVWWANDLDIQFFTDPPTAGFLWEYGPALPSFTEYDFETVALHELGHHHGLGHIIAPGAVMHYAISNGSANRVLSDNDIVGGNAKMAYSTVATCFNPAGSGTPMTAIIPSQCGTLPVRLLSFSGEKTSETVNRLVWETEQELNSKGFYLQRSKDGINFSDITFVRSNGNSTERQQYGHNDFTAGPYGWHYRLRMVDIDNKEEYSSIVFIEGDKTSDWKLWTNVSGDRIYLFSRTGVTGTAALKLFTAAGQQVLVRTILPGHAEITEVSALPRGIYMWQLIHDDKIKTGKMMLGTR